mmetsp:Transcript_16327/g.21333  ORF Transcript_16327/g.21333 Transcript_16327/m.21333 type:complete len:284 (-) Transcript_16327:99-950(-)
MFKAEPENFLVRYRVGRPDMMPSTISENAELAQEAMQMWGALPGSATRRRNPYLESSVRWIEYNETIVPMRCAQLIMQTREQLAHEWARDLRSLAQIAAPDDYEKLTRNAPIEAIATFEDHVSSPLRGANLDLCDRLVTRFAANEILEELRIDGLHHAATVLASHLELVGTEDTSIDASTTNNNDDDQLAASLNAAVCRVLSVDALGGHARTRGLALRWLDRLPDTQIADSIRNRRITIARTWAPLIVDVALDQHQSLIRNNLEAQLDASIPIKENKNQEDDR